MSAFIVRITCMGWKTRACAVVGCPLHELGLAPCTFHTATTCKLHMMLITGLASPTPRCNHSHHSESATADGTSTSPTAISCGVRIGASAGRASNRSGLVGNQMIIAQALEGLGTCHVQTLLPAVSKGLSHCNTMYNYLNMPFVWL